MTVARLQELLANPRLRLVALTIAALVLALATASRVSAGGERAAAPEQAQAAALHYAALLDPERKRLASLEQDPTLVALLVAGDQDALRDREAAIAAELPGLLRVRLLPLGVVEPDTRSKPPLTYASLALLRRAETTPETLAAEALLMGSPEAHVVMVGRLRAEDGTLAGLVHFSIDPARLNAPPAALAGHVELQQPVAGGKPLVLSRAGAAGQAAAGVQPARVPVPGTVWEVAYWPAPSGVSAVLNGEAGAAWPYVAAAALVLVVGVLAVLLLRRRREAAPAGDTTVYAGAVQAIKDGAYPGLERLVPGMPGAPASVPRARPARPRPAVGEPVPASAPAEAAASPAAAEPAIDFGQAPEPLTLEVPRATRVPASIFRPYDVRGVVEEALSEDVVYLLGRAIGSEAAARGQSALLVARDCRNSSPALTEALIKGLLECGREVIDIGLAPAPVLYFATQYLDVRSGVMVTGSHNGPEYNGLKIVIDGEDLSGERILALRERIEIQDFVAGSGTLQQAEMTTEYIRRVSEDIPVALGRSLKIVVDCGNAVSGMVAPALLRALGHDVVELFCELDGSFPNHQPDPSQPENLVSLVYKVLEEEADLGLAFDGDGDRLGVVDGDGNIIWPDRQMMLLARDVLSRNPGAQVVYDVKCSRHLGREIEAAGGRPVMCKTGRSFVRARMKEGNAPLAGEFSGHFFFADRWYGFDDAFYAAARLVEILLADGRSSTAVFDALPNAVATAELRVQLPSEQCQALVEQLLAQGGFEGGVVSEVDGLRVDFEDGFGLVRPSNTAPCLVMRFEGDGEQALQRIQQAFARRIGQVAPDLALPF